MTPWRIRAVEYANCNCSYGCPCQFNALPTHGHCQAIAAYRIDEGYFGDTRLDGLRGAGVYKWPGAVHEGNGAMQLIIDERADEAQRAALEKIMRGEETEPFATMWNVYASTSTEVHPTRFERIDLEIDVEGRTARCTVGEDLISTRIEPIRNPVTGNPHRARIDLPHGFEYEIAEIASGTSKVKGPIALDLGASYAQLAYIHLGNNGVVR